MVNLELYCRASTASMLSSPPREKKWGNKKDHIQWLMIAFFFRSVENSYICFKIFASPSFVMPRLLQWLLLAYILMILSSFHCGVSRVEYLRICCVIRSGPYSSEYKDNCSMRVSLQGCTRCWYLWAAAGTCLAVFSQCFSKAAMLLLPDSFATIISNQF